MGVAVDRSGWVPSDIEIDQPSIARVYDYYLGGSNNFAADRDFAARVLAAVPSLPQVLQQNRAFLRRAVRYLVDQGIRQFVDLGSGIPTVGNVHEVAQAIDPRSRVVYVDTDPVAVAHSRVILDGNPLATIIPADLRQPAQVLGDSELRQLIDLDEPVGVLLVAVLPFVPDTAEATGIVTELRGQIAPGSYVAISHPSADHMRDGFLKTQSLYSESVAAMRMRSHSEITGLFGSLRLVEPGVVQIPLWRPDSPEDAGPDAAGYPGYAGVGRVD
jgi:hypothetical protein